MDRDAFWFFKCTQHIHAFDESSSEAFSGKFVVVYIDDICNPSKESHLQYLKDALDVLKGEKLHANTKECGFFIDSLLFLGYVVSVERIKVDNIKVEAIRSCLISKTVREVYSFHGLASF